MLDFNCSKTVANYTRVINAGCVAKIVGEPRDSNPHGVGTPEHEAWNHGYDRA